MMILLFNLSENSGTPFGSRIMAVAGAKGVPHLNVTFKLSYHPRQPACRKFELHTKFRHVTTLLEMGL